MAARMSGVELGLGPTVHQPPDEAADERQPRVHGRGRLRQLRVLPRLERKLHRRLLTRDPDIVKISTMANHPHDNLRMLRLSQQSKVPTIGLCMGDIGLPTRLLAGKFGSPFTYATFHHERVLAPGQLSYQQMVETYHYDQIDADTDQWEWHPDWKLGDAGFPIIGYDVLNNGKTDIIYGQGHSYGIYWLEQIVAQKGDGATRTWVKHTVDESFSQGRLEYPQWTRPPEFRGLNVPDVLLSGNHAQVAVWRKLESLRRTQARRPDLLLRHPLSEDEQALLSGMSKKRRKKPAPQR